MQSLRHNDLLACVLVFGLAPTNEDARGANRQRQELPISVKGLPVMLV
ncbi:hypothetical protein IYX23_07560 [Methylocystis sp. L43]|nr:MULTISPECIES: hypothetical protein [unclassified Methylocystis]MBG0797524.1 hypothetical protein [Methylocystis sp. L43]MBG0805129.1 hypothetical protein [Methylocystis sp. H15]